MFLTETFPKIEQVAPNLTRVDWGPVTLWYSYTSPIAFLVSGNPLVVRQNEWGPTTGKHINAVSGGNKTERVDFATFARLWKEQLSEWFRDSGLPL